ncbi:MAG: hypothetical protein CMH46_18905 [Muricauda sp.]|nr:restriction endonuclease subunit S [Allomuricauda sp.]MAU17601.1 hypothetical protein [Allomuricauda sp.]|tara:strand:- start:12993 stop:14147 length:1155 start_codon:yes stop_codon:yes gene_type:complete
MSSNYKRIGEYIELVDERNSDLSINLLLGLTVDKKFIPSVANTVGTNMKNYKIIRKNQFACSMMQVRRDKKMPIAILKDFEEAIISQAYPVFQVVDESLLDPDYLMMWFSREEFDRQATFHAVGGVRGSLEWEDFLDFELPIPSIEKQREIVKEYNTVTNRIKLNEQLNQKLEETAQALYKHWFVSPNKKYSKKKLGDITSLITDGKHGNCKDEPNSGYYFLSAKDVRHTLMYDNARQINKKEFDETHRRTDLNPKDICLVNTGATIGRMCLAPANSRTRRTTFQKSVAVIKPKESVSSGFYLYCLLKNEMREIIELGKGTSQSNLLLGDLKEFEVDFPETNKIQEFEIKVTPIFNLLESNSEENFLLEKIKLIILMKMSNVKN